MFFGFDKFNLSMSDTRYLNVETSNISLVSLYYQKNSAVNEVKINMFFFAFRNCLNYNHYYDPLNYTCLPSCPSNSTPYPTSTYGPADFLWCRTWPYDCNIISNCNNCSNLSGCSQCSTGYHLDNFTYCSPICGDGILLSS